MRLAWLVMLIACLGPRPAAAQGHLVVITGLSGEQQYAEQFHAWASQIITSASRYGDVNVVYLGEDPKRAPDLISARSTRENVEATLRELAANTQAGEQVVIVFIGHGSYRDGQSLVNLPGPDMSGADFAALLDGFSTRRIVFVNVASSSGDFIAELSAEGRIIVTATRSGRERYETQFGRYFAEALASQGADLDKDQRVSVLEAFTYANAEVARYYDQQNRLATEHSLLDDNGDGEGSEEPGPEAADGALASVVYLIAASPLAAATADADPRLAPLLAEKRKLEEEIALLRSRKDSMQADEYDRELEELVVQLALNSRAIREITERAP